MLTIACPPTPLYSYALLTDNSDFWSQYLVFCLHLNCYNIWWCGWFNSFFSGVIPNTYPCITCPKQSYLRRLTWFRHSWIELMFTRTFLCSVCTIVLMHDMSRTLSQLKIWHFRVIGIERNVCRCTSNRYSVIMQFANLSDGKHLCHCCTHRQL
jgi:hypothetical protein